MADTPGFFGDGGDGFFGVGEAGFIDCHFCVVFGTVGDAGEFGGAGKQLDIATGNHAELGGEALVEVRGKFKGLACGLLFIV